MIRPSRCASSWREPNEPDTWMATDASGRSIEKLATLLTTSLVISPVRNASNSRWRSLHGGLAGDEVRVQVLRERVQLVEVLADDQGRVALVLGDELLDHAVLARGGRGEPVLLLRLGGRVGHAVGVGQRQAHLDAVGGGDVALRLDVLPGRVEPLGPDEAEHLVLAAVLAHQRGGQAEAAAGLQVGRHAEDRRRAAGGPRRRPRGPSRGRRAARGACRRPSASSSAPGRSRW